MNKSLTNVEKSHYQLSNNMVTDSDLMASRRLQSIEKKNKNNMLKKKRQKKGKKNNKNNNNDDNKQTIVTDVVTFDSSNNNSDNGDVGIGGCITGIVVNLPPQLV